MAARVFSSIEDIEKAVGDDLGCTEWLTVDQGTVDGFADVTGDHQWIHVEVERATESSFGGTIAHGYLTLSMLPRFAGELYSIECGSARLNYGLEKARFPAPLPVGARVQATPRIKEVRQVPSGHRVVVAWTVVSDRSDRPVCVAESITLVVP